MKILAIDTATERCSVALLLDDRFIERSQDTQRTHADLVLPMVADVLREGGLRLTELDCMAYGRGPGAFTGVRIAVSVVQGLAFGAQKLTVGVSNLAAVAQQVVRGDEEILVCMDARMGEVYWARFRSDGGMARAVSDERVDKPERVEAGAASVFAGTGFRAYPHIAPAGARTIDTVLPRAKEIALLGAREFAADRGVPASQAAPVYLRDQVATVKTPS
jgi:tRNA threonylcarbamoyladenosine biosynthesis protein TsaB